MLHELLVAYLGRVERTIRECGQAYVEQYVEEILTPERTNLRIRLRFEWGDLLEISEAVVVEGGCLVPLDYRYHTVRMDPIVLFSAMIARHISPAWRVFPTTNTCLMRCCLPTSRKSRT